MAKPGRRTNLNQIKSLEPKFAPNISETNFGKKYPNKAPEATARPSKKANIKRRELFSDLKRFFIKDLCLQLQLLLLLRLIQEDHNQLELLLCFHHQIQLVQIQLLHTVHLQ